jgi:molecular chaperone DnaK
MGMTIGIDLGTTNSVTCIKKINVSSIRNAEGEELTPSSVTAVPHSNHASFDLVVGRHSRDLLKQYPEQTILSVKRLMGRDFEDAEVQSIINNNGASYLITTDASEPGSIRIPLNGKAHTPEMISGIILSKLIRDGEVELQGKIDQAVVTVPAYFSDRQKFATRAACDYAGIKLLRLLPEPTAAALSFGLGELDHDEARTIMVFDLGGGTFDISVLSFAGGSFMEITKGGDMWLGGDNIDQLLVNHIFSCAEAAANCTSITTLLDRLSPADKARFIVEIKEKAEAAKIELSTQESVSVEMFGLLKDENNQLVDIDVTIDQTEFAQLIQPIVERVTEIAEQILHEIRFEPELIDTVLLVGGSSLVPAIQDALKQMFGEDKVKLHPRPMLAIAEGAALMAAKMMTQDNAEASFTMMHSTAHDYYLQLAGGKKHLLVARNTPLPVVVEEKLTFSHSTQSLARLRVFNEVEGLLDTVGELWFHKQMTETFTPDNEKPTELMLRFSVDEDNIITMKAWSLGNEEQSIEAQIARGGLAAKLYNDLESTLSFIVANCTNGSIEEDALVLSRFVVATILSASDPLTGETCLDQKQKAQRQITTLKYCQQHHIAPLSQYKFAEAARDGSATVLSKDDYERLNTLVERFKQAIDNLDDAEEFKVIHEELTQLYEDMPITVDLARAENAAAVLIAENSLKEAKKIRDQAQVLVSLYGHKDEDAIEAARDKLDELVDAELSYYNPPQGRFDRDVHL